MIQVVDRALRENKGQEQGLIRSGKGSDFSAKPETQACKVGQLAMLCVCWGGWGGVSEVTQRDRVSKVKESEA